jgi:hypothetical protein
LKLDILLNSKTNTNGSERSSGTSSEVASKFSLETFDVLVEVLVFSDDGFALIGESSATSEGVVVDK